MVDGFLFLKKMEEDLKKPTKKKEEPWYQSSLILFSRLSGWIGGPVIVALFLGKKLDEKFSSQPWGFLACVGVAFILSSAGIVWEAQKAMKEMEKKEEMKKEDKKEDEKKEL